MKRIKIRALCLAVTLFSLIIHANAQSDYPGSDNAPELSTQTSSTRELSAIDLKLDLAETKLELLDSKIRLWEDKPAALERELLALDGKIRQLSFSPEQFNEKFMLLDSMLIVQEGLMAQQQEILERIEQSGNRFGGIPEGERTDGSQERASMSQEGRDPNVLSPSLDDSYPQHMTEPPRSKYVISIYPIRIFEGTMQLSLEWVLNRGNALEISAMATYAAREGVANYYLANQKLDYYNARLDSYVPYESENITGYGTSLAWRNYLLPRTRPSYAAPRGVYAAPSVMYRRLTLSGFDYVFNEETGVTEQVEVEQYLNILSGGILAGWQFVLWNAVTADIYVGGMVRLSKYDGDSGFTKYKQVRNIDFSGVMPTFGVKIGIVK